MSREDKLKQAIPWIRALVESERNAAYHNGYEAGARAAAVKVRVAAYERPGGEGAISVVPAGAVEKALAAVLGQEREETSN